VKSNKNFLLLWRYHPKWVIYKWFTMSLQHLSAKTVLYRLFSDVTLWILEHLKKQVNIKNISKENNLTATLVRICG